LGREKLKLRWTRPALADLIEAQNYIARENPVAAQALAQRVWDAAQNLCEHPRMGRPGHVDGTREWIVKDSPYLIVYRVRDEDVEILRMWHGRQNWQVR
jgi:toxin ParE1/3/4